jgi:hypothetical protein
MIGKFSKNSLKKDFITNGHQPEKGRKDFSLQYIDNHWPKLGKRTW